jgi:hypothetical protein
VTTLTPRNPNLRTFPASSTLQRSRTHALEDDITPTSTTCNAARSCQMQEYEVFFRSHGSTAAVAKNPLEAASDRNPDVVQNCAICRHASGLTTFNASSNEISTAARLYEDTERY